MKNILTACIDGPEQQDQGYPVQMEHKVSHLVSESSVAPMKGGLWGHNPDFKKPAGLGGPEAPRD